MNRKILQKTTWVVQARWRTSWPVDACRRTASC